MHRGAARRRRGAGGGGGGGGGRRRGGRAAGGAAAAAAVGFAAALARIADRRTRRASVARCLAARQGPRIFPKCLLAPFAQIGGRAAGSVAGCAALRGGRAAGAGARWRRGAGERGGTG